ncbi:MAG: PilW family protein [Pseudomonadota bacterium]
MITSATKYSSSARHQRGVTLTELMVALVIGLILIGGALVVFLESRETAQVNQTVARLQENASFAAEEIARSVELSGYWGQNNSTSRITDRTVRVSGSLTDSSSAMHGASSLTNPGSDCSNNTFPSYSDLHRPLDGLDASPTSQNALANAETGYTWGTCAPNYLQGTDVLITRFVEPTETATGSLAANTVYVRSDPVSGALFVGSTEPTGFSASAANYRLRSYVYYVSDNDTTDNIPPNLVRVDVTSFDPANAAAGLTSVQEVIMPGVEDFQVQYGIDTNGDGSANQYVNASGATAAEGVQAAEWNNVVAVRFWLLLRPEDNAGFEPGFDTANPIELNPLNFDLPQVTGFDPNDDGFRRIMITRTVRVRNHDEET